MVAIIYPIIRVKNNNKNNTKNNSKNNTKE